MAQTTAPAYDLSLDCVHCGLCLSSCPTYTLDYNEADSPRGRIYLMRALFENRVGVSDPFVRHLDLCLGCRGCETVCPAGVKYGELLEHTRAHVARTKKRGLTDYFKKIVLQEIFPYPKRLRTVASLLRLYQVSGVETLVNSLSLPAVLGRGMADVARNMPRIPTKSERRLPHQIHEAFGEKRGRVALLTGCVMNELYNRVHRATIHILQHNGFEVTVPQSQGCCGALHLHTGDLATAKDLARHNLRQFDLDDCDAIIVNSAGCGSAMKETGALFEGDEDHEAAAYFSTMVRDVSEFLAGIELRDPWAPVRRRVAYDDACHLIHAQGIQSQPRDLLGRIPELELVPLCDADRCCGGAGSYFLEENETSMRILEEKIDQLRASGADTVATGNPGCLLQLELGAKKFGLDIPVLHTMELLAEGYRQE